MIWYLVIGSVVLLVFGYLVDLFYKRRGIKVDPEENAKHVSESERVYIESHMHNMRNDHNNTGIF